MLGRRYSFLQVQTLATMFFAVTAFTCVKVGKMSGPVVEITSTGPLIGSATVGFIFTGLAVGLNVLAGILVEKALVDSNISMAVTIARMKVGESFVAFVLVSFVPGAPLPFTGLMQNPSEFFKGFDTSVWIVVASLVVDSWCSVLIVKQISSVAKAVAKCTSLMMLYLLSVFILNNEDFMLLQLLLASLVANSAGQFTYISMMETKVKSGEGPLDAEIDQVEIDQIAADGYWIPIEGCLVCAGDVVRVADEYTSDSIWAYLKPGMQGRVVEVNTDDDICILFPAIAQVDTRYHWTTRRKFQHLLLRADERRLEVTAGGLLEDLPPVCLRPSSF